MNVVDEEFQSERNDASDTMEITDYREERDRDKAITDKCQQCGKYQDAIDESVTKKKKKQVYPEALELTNRETNTETTSCGPSLT